MTNPFHEPDYLTPNQVGHTNDMVLYNADDEPVEVEARLDQIETKLDQVIQGINQIGLMMNMAKDTIDQTVGQLASNPMISKMFGVKG